MIPKYCAICEQHVAAKPASLYWAWVNANGKRRAWKQKVCAECFREHYVPLIVASMEPVLTCPQCGISTVDDYDAIYLTYCLPGMPQDQSEMPMCGACAVIVRQKALQSAVELPDREASIGGPQSTPPTGAETWAALGLRPR